MKFLRRDALWIYVLIICLAFPLATSLKCDGKTQKLVAKTMAQSIRSPGHPNNYEANDECTYIIHTELPSEEYMMQISVMELALSDPKGDCSDYLEIYEGDKASGTLLERLCGESGGEFKSHSSTVTLYFKSDDSFEDKGYTVFYQMVKYASHLCMEKADNPIIIGLEPMYKAFHGSNTLPKCEWSIQSDDPGRYLMFEVFKASKISCQDALFTFYEGNSTANHVSYQYCSTLNPFSRMYLSSDKAMLTFDLKEGAQINEDDDLILKISTHFPTYSCTSTNRATLEVAKDPVVFPLPFLVHGSGEICPVTLVTPEDNQFIRVDVMGTSDGKTSCDTEVIDVMVSQRTQKIDKECNEATATPVYRQSSKDGVDIISKTGAVVYIRASTVPEVCSGIVTKKKAFEDVVLKEHVPSADGYPNLAHCRYLISTDKPGDIVSLNITWKKDKDETDLANAPGDFIKVYDGATEDSPVLFSSLGKPELLDNKIVTVLSTQKDMLLVLDSDARITGNALHIAYFSLTGGNYCPSTGMKIMLDREAQYIMSPNYPDAVPLHQTCLYHLVSENPDDHIVVEVVDANLLSQCENLLTLYDGDVSNSSEQNALGQVCGKERPKFEHDNDVSLLATTGDKANPGGWKVKVYAQPKLAPQQSPPKDSSSRPSPEISVLVLLSLIIARIVNLI